MAKRAAIIMAGGSGERFWPASTWDHPKQFLALTSDSRPLLDLARERAAALAGNDHVWLATLPHLLDGSRVASPGLSPDRMFAEPDKRNTAGCLIWAAAHFMAADPEGWQDTIWAVLTADQTIEPLDGFLQTAEKAIQLAQEHDALVTIGIPPDRPETGFGYIELGGCVGPGYQAERFREKPDLETAQAWLEEGGFLWNSGMFFWTLGAFARELERTQPEMRQVLGEIAHALARGERALAEEAFRRLPNLSIDVALMEKAEKVCVVPAEFTWDDLGSWPALSRTLGVDETNSTVRGAAVLHEVSGCVVDNQSTQTIHLLGVEDLVVVATDDAILICPKDRSQDIKIFAKGAIKPVSKAE